jgi:hypothetical protein
MALSCVVQISSSHLVAKIRLDLRAVLASAAHKCTTESSGQRIFRVSSIKIPLCSAILSSCSRMR